MRSCIALDVVILKIRCLFLWFWIVLPLSHYLDQCWRDSLTNICGTRERRVNASLLQFNALLVYTQKGLNTLFIKSMKQCNRSSTFPLNTWRNNNVVITSKRRHFDVITSKWRRFDVIMTLLLRNVFAGLVPTIMTFPALYSLNSVTQGQSCNNNKR